MERLGQIRDRSVGTSELLQNAASGGVRERGEGGIESAALDTEPYGSVCTNRSANARGLHEGDRYRSVEAGEPDPGLTFKVAVPGRPALPRQSTPRHDLDEEGDPSLARCGWIDNPVLKERREERWTANRRYAVVAGVLFILATVADLISRVVLVQPILSAPVDLTKISANEDQVLLGALFLFIGAAAAAGIAIALYPVLRKHDEGLALGSVGFRLIEGALYIGIVVCLLMLVTLSQESANAGAAASSAYQVPGCAVDGST